MNEADFFADFLSRLRAHDEAAAKQLVDLCGPVIFQVVGRRLFKARLSSTLDPEDIVQKVYAKFFAQIDRKCNLASVQELIKVLVTMTVHVLQDEHRHADARRRSSGQPTDEHASLEATVSSEHEPGYDLEIEEEINRIHKLLSPEEWNLVWAWACGPTWKEIAAACGGSPDALRKQFARVMTRIRDNPSPESSTEAMSPPQETDQGQSL